MNTPDVWIQLLDAGRVRLNPGLTDHEIAVVARRYAFTFAPVHRRFLATCLPVDDGCVDWRQASDTNIESRLGGPAEGLIFDVKTNSFWPRSWGARPQIEEDATRLALAQISRLPRLIPIFSHRYLPAAPTVEPTPVFSVHQSDVIYYGYDLADYLAHEFTQPRQPKPKPPDVPFWSDLAFGAEPEDL